MTLGRCVAAAVIAGATAGIVLPIVTTGGGLAAAVALGSMVAGASDLRVRAWLLGAALFAMSTAHGAAARDAVIHAPLLVWFEQTRMADLRRPVTLGGRLTRDADRIEAGARLHIDVTSVTDGGTTVAIRGRVQAYVAGSITPEFTREWTAGRTIRAPVTLRLPPLSLNPGGPGERWQTLRRPADLVGTIKSPLVVEVGAGPWWDEFAAAVRALVRRAAARAFPDEQDPAGAVVVAILIGDRSALDDETERRLQIAGTYHVIAISGGNVALLTALLFLLLRMLIRSAPLVSVLTIAGVVAYGWIVGGEPSVTRAVTAAVIYLGCDIAGLTPRPLDALATVALLVVVSDPMAVVDAGAWLSFGATLGIVVGARRLTAWHDAVWPATTTLRRGRSWALGLCGATLAAELTILPVSAAVFMRVGVAGLALNLIAIPMIAVVQIVGGVSVALAGVWESAAFAAAIPARWATRAILSSSALVDAAPWLSWRVPPPGGFVVALYYAAGIASVSLLHQRARRGAAALFAGAGLTIVIAPFTAFALPPAGWLRVTVMDVGQGESILVQFPSGQSMLVDAGGATARFDSGERLVMPAVWASGVDRLDWLAFTHADLDHIGGAAAVAATLEPREIWEGIPVLSERRRHALWELARRRRMVWRQLQRNDTFEAGGATVAVRGPERADWERQRVRNDDSLVLSIRYGDAEVILTGDIGEEGERRLLSTDPPAPLRVLKVAHHGSRSSSSQAFLDWYRPQVAVISAGRANPFGHPSRDVLDRLRAIGAEIFRTDADGAVIIETDGRALVVRSMTGRLWRVGVVRWSALPPPMPLPVLRSSHRVRSGRRGEGDARSRRSAA